MIATSPIVYSLDHVRGADGDALALAWRQMLAGVRTSKAARVTLVCGAPGAGKSTWIREHGRERDGGQVYVDTTGASRGQRGEVVAAAHAAGADIACVWLDTPRHICLERNAARDGTRAPDEAVERIWTTIKNDSPTVDEGYISVWWVTL